MTNQDQIALEVDKFPPEYGDCLTGFDCFIIEIDLAYAQLIQRRIDTFKEAKRKDRDLWEMFFWDNSGKHFAQTWDNEDQIEPKGDPSRSECNQMIVREASVQWFCYPKHGDTHIATHEVSAATIAKIVAGVPAREAQGAA